jgi:LacI family transcriptional regulator
MLPCRFLACAAKRRTEIHLMNLKDLATRLGMSQTTVSRALNGYPEVSQRTREVVLAAAERAGYRPNPAARRLATGKADAIGIIYPLIAEDLGDPYFLNVLSGMTKALGETDMDLMIASASSTDEIRTYERMIQGRRVDGMVVARTRVHDPRLLLLEKKGVPFVAYGRSTLSKPYAWLDFDMAAGIKKAVERLVSLGHHRIALVGGPSDLYYISQARQGFIDAMNSFGLDVLPDYTPEAALESASGYRAMAKLLSLSPRPTAVIADNARCGVGAIGAIRDAGLVVGSEISIIVNEGIPRDMLAGHIVTALHADAPERVGAKIVQMMLALLEGAPAGSLQVLLEPDLKIGNSDGPCIA